MRPEDNYTFGYEPSHGPWKLIDVFSVIGLIVAILWLVAGLPGLR